MGCWTAASAQIESAILSGAPQGTVPHCRAKRHQQSLFGAFMLRWVCCNGRRTVVMRHQPRSTFTLFMPGQPMPSCQHFSSERGCMLEHGSSASLGPVKQGPNAKIYTYSRLAGLVMALGCSGMHVLRCKWRMIRTCKIRGTIPLRSGHTRQACTVSSRSEISRKYQ